MSSVIKTARISETPLSLERSPRQAGERRPPPRESTPAPASIAAPAVPAPRVEARVAAEALAPALPPAPPPPDAAQREAERQDLARRQERAESEGYERGLQRAAAESERQRREELQRLRALAESLEVERNRFAGRLEDSAVEIVFESLARLLGHALAGAAGVAAAVREVIDRHAAGQKTLAIRVAPADLELLGEAGIAAIRSGLRADIQFEADERLHPGGCLIDMPSGSLDARLEFQMERLKQALLDARRAGE